jgi:hypothetical protein
VAAFGCYFCTYGFRKPFTAAAYDGTPLWDVGFKSIVVTSQMLGYAISKFAGIRVISEMPPGRRSYAILLFVLLAQAALVLFGIVPRPWNAICLFLNGLPLGMVFGLVQGYLEGRRTTEILAAALCASFIMADGFSKTVGSWLLGAGISENWMPSVAGWLFLVPLILFVAILHHTPPPDSRDVLARNHRDTMTHSDRWNFLSCTAAGLIPLILFYLLITIVRSFRADFAREIWIGLGRDAAPATFTQTETLVAMVVLVINGGVVLIGDNRRAFLAALVTCGLGLGLMGVALVLPRQGEGAGYTFMILTGLGLYLPYVAFHTTLFERMLAFTRERGNLGFLIYVADSIGYLGYVCVMIARNNWTSTKGELYAFNLICWITVVVAAVCLLVSWHYFSHYSNSSQTSELELANPDAVRAEPATEMKATT